MMIFSRDFGFIAFGLGAVWLCAHVSIIVSGFIFRALRDHVKGFILMCLLLGPSLLLIAWAMKILEDAASAAAVVDSVIAVGKALVLSIVAASLGRIAYAAQMDASADKDFKARFGEWRCARCGDDSRPALPRYCSYCTTTGDPQPAP